MTNEEIERGLLWNNLVNLGGYTKLGLHANPWEVEQQLIQFKDNWCRYNQKKDGDNNRWGLPLTSLSGDINDNDHLNSFLYMQKSHNVVLNESDFTTPTQAYYALPSIAKIIDLFAPDIGRVHILRIDKGGYWPPHRDYQFFAPEYFRLLMFFGNCCPTSFYTIFNRNIITSDPGFLYFANTQLEHSVFSFVDNAYCLVLSVKLNKRTHDIILNNLETY